MTAQVHPENSPPANAHNGSSVNNIRIGLEGATLGIVVSLMLVIGACGVVMGLNISEQHALVRQFDGQQKQAQQLADDRERHVEAAMVDMQRQSRMTELKLDDWTVVAHRAGLQLPGDYTRGPQGNTDAESFHIKHKGK